MSVAVIDSLSRLLLDRKPAPRSLLIIAAVVIAGAGALAATDGLMAPLLFIGAILGAAAAAFLLTRPLLTLFIGLFFRSLHYSDPETGITHVIQPIANGALLLAICAWLLKAHADRSRIVWNDVFLFMGAFILWGAISLYWAGDFNVGFENLRRYGVGLISIFLLLQQVRTPETLDAFMRLLSALGWVLAILGLHAVFFTDFQFGERLKVPGFNENEVGSMLILFLPGPLWPAMRSVGKDRAVSIAFGVLYVVLVSILILLSGSRGSTLALVLTLTALCLWKPLRFWGAVGGGAALVILLTSAPFLLDSLSKRFEDEGNELGKRDVLWDGSIRLIEDYPLTGVGIGNGALELPHYAGITLINRSDMPPHNILFEVTIETGIIGLILYASFFASAYFQFLATRRLMQREDSGGFLLPPGYFPSVIAVSLGFAMALLKDGGANNPGVSLMIFMLIMPTNFTQAFAKKPHQNTPSTQSA